MSGGERLDTPGAAVSNSGATSYTSEGEHDGVNVEDSSLGEIVGKLASDLSRLMRAEMALAKAEAREEIKDAGKSAGMFAGAGYAGHLLVLFLSLAVMFGLGHWMPLGWAALIVGVVWGIVAFILYTRARSSMQRATPPMPETVETLKEDAQWAKKPRG